MHHFAYRDGVLHAEDVNLKVIAEDVGSGDVGKGLASATEVQQQPASRIEGHNDVFEGQ